MVCSLPDSHQSGRQAKPACQRVRDAKQLDADLTSAWSAFIASQPFLPTQAITCALCPGERSRCKIWASREILLHLHIYPLMTKQLHACPGVSVNFCREKTKVSPSVEVEVRSSRTAHIDDRRLRKKGVERIALQDKFVEEKKRMEPDITARLHSCAIASSRRQGPCS